jgi:hypothetical protein
MPLSREVLLGNVIVASALPCAARGSARERHAFGCSGSGLWQVF